jgi:hypothetical protein
MIDVEPLIVSELERMLPLPSGSRADWSDVLRRSGLPGKGHRRRWRPVVAAVVVVAALVGAGVAIAAGFGAFDGISAAQHPQTPADRIDPALLALINAANTGRGAGDQLLANSARLVRHLSGGTRIYAVATKDGQLCVLAEGLAGSNTGRGGANAMGCGSPLTQSQPTTLASFKANRGTPTINWGIALDHINAVSFDMAGQEVTVPVRNNVWAYEGASPRDAQSVVVHYDDGTTVTLTP